MTENLDLDTCEDSRRATSALFVSDSNTLNNVDISAAASNLNIPVPPCYEGSKLRESLDSAQVDNMLEFLSKKEDLRLINQQRDEPDLTSEQQLDRLKIMFDSDPFSFLQRFGKHLDPIHLECFSSPKGIDPEKKPVLKLHLTALESIMKSANNRVMIKNRRYEALQKMVDTTNYFTEEEMQRRNPILFEQLIGRYHTKEEREAFLQLSQVSTTSTPLSDMLMAHMSRLDGQVSERRTEQEMQIDQEEAADEEYFDSDPMDEEDFQSANMQKSKEVDDEEEREEIDEEEKDVLKEEFFTTMYRSFLEGKDEDFDYGTVDNNEEYDCGEILNQDAEDKYFDAEESQMYSSETELLNNGTTYLGDDQSSEIMLNPHGTHNNEDESEDELDLYMKSIEKQLNS